jgi:hypothetical protein
MKQSISRSAGQLEQAFFLNQENVLIENMRKLEKRKRTAEELAAISGIQNQHLIEKFLELEIEPKDLAAVSVVPLVVVAWADGSVDDKERAAVMLAAEKMGFSKGCENYAMLQDWLTHKPKPQLLDAWSHYVEGIVGEMSAQDTAVFKQEILEHAQIVAKASGGMLGMAKVSANEKAVLTQLENAFAKKS